MTIPTHEKLVENAKRSIGRPTVYDTKMCEEALEWLSDCRLKRTLCARFSIVHDTLNRWIREKPEFSAAVHKGLEVGLTRFIEDCKLRRSDKETNAAIVQILARNMYKLDVKEIDKKQHIGELSDDPQLALMQIAKKASTAKVAPSVAKVIADIVNMQVSRKIAELEDKVARLEAKL